MHGLSIVTRNNNPKKLKLPIIKEQECYLQGSSSHQAGDRVFRSLGLSRSGTVDVFHTLQSQEHNKDLSCGFLDKLQIIMPCETYMESPEFVTASSHCPHIGEEGKKVPAWKGRGGVEQEDPGAGYLWSSYSVSRSLQ